ncbi:signal peptidase-like protein I [Xylogone sp. PMI_703]|nr:signal peptidase-like protein I [Xylogone sp. PMI_703]
MAPYNRIFQPFKSFQSRYAGHPFRLLVATIKFTFAAHVFCEYAYVPVPAWGPSMLPTFEVLGDWLLISRQYRRGRGIEIGDFVTFDSVVEPGERAIKRVIGLEGDYVLRDTPGSRSTEMLQVPKGHCWVVGDNLPYSRDSRHFGPMPMALIKGKVIAKVLPWDERRWIVNDVQPVTDN